MTLHCYACALLPLSATYLSPLNSSIPGKQGPTSQSLIIPHPRMTLYANVSRPARRPRKEYYDKTVKDLPPLHSGQQILMQDNRGTWTPATVVEKRPEPRSYTIHTHSGGLYRRNDDSFWTCRLHTSHGQMRRLMLPPTIPRVSDNRRTSQQHR